MKPEEPRYFGIRSVGAAGTLRRDSDSITAPFDSELAAARRKPGDPLRIFKNFPVKRRCRVRAV
jgi:hypothetical protein